MIIEKELLQILACPVCRGEVLPEMNEAGDAAEGLACAACALVYPVRQGIPVMLREEALPRLEWQSGKRRASRRNKTL